jgi:4'-phosphopantetheinyl transferase
VSRLHLWLTQGFEDLPPDDDWLSVRERTILEGFRVTKRHDEWRLGRWTAKLTVAAALGETVSPASLEILASGDGHPEAFDQGGSVPLSLSLSHSAARGLAVVAPGGMAVGCDIESIEDRTSTFVTDYFTSPEADAVRAAGPERRELLATLLWSAKESALKALRTGLRADTRSIEVSVPDTTTVVDGWSPLGIDKSRLSGWWRREASAVLTVVTDSPLGPPARAAGS